MNFITPDDITRILDSESIALEVNKLLLGDIKLQTLHNHTSMALKENDIEKYINKSIVKSYYRFLTKHEE